MTVHDNLEKKLETIKVYVLDILICVARCGKILVLKKLLLTFFNKATFL